MPLIEIEVKSIEQLDFSDNVNFRKSALYLLNNKPCTNFSLINQVSVYSEVLF